MQYQQQPGMQQQQPGMRMQPGMQQGMQQGMQPGMRPGMHAMPMQGYGMAPQDMSQGNGMNSPYPPTPNGYPMGGMSAYAPSFVPSGYQPPQGPPTDEEQAWLDAQMDQQVRQMPPMEKPVSLGHDEPTEDEVEVAAAAAPPTSSAEPGGYDEVMKMIEENRKKNEAKRAAQSARNAQIVADFEARSGGAPSYTG